MRDSDYNCSDCPGWPPPGVVEEGGARDVHARVFAEDRSQQGCLDGIHSIAHRTAPTRSSPFVSH